MTTTLKAFLLALILSTFPSVHAQGTASSQPVRAAQATQVSRDLQVLGAQIEAANRTSDKILATVYWSLGVCVTIVFLLTGYSWFANFRIYERDKATLERELKLLLQERIGAIEASTRDAITNAQAGLKESLAAETKKAVSSQLSAVKSDLSSIRNHVLGIQLHLKLEERKQWRISESFRNSLSCGVEALDLANRLEDEFQVGDILDLIADDMTKCRGRAVDNFLIAQLVAALDAVKGHHASSAANLKQRASGLATPGGA